VLWLVQGVEEDLCLLWPGWSPNASPLADGAHEHEKSLVQDMRKYMLRWCSCKYMDSRQS
jgi:hypothetical protein